MRRRAGDEDGERAMKTAVRRMPRRWRQQTHRNAPQRQRKRSTRVRGRDAETRELRS